LVTFGGSADMKTKTNGCHVMRWLCRVELVKEI